jgi:hypothetical protein
MLCVQTAEEGKRKDAPLDRIYGGGDPCLIHEGKNFVTL